jgi:hypothetical protein
LGLCEGSLRKRIDRARDNLAGANEDELGWGVCDRAGAGVAAHAPGTRGVFVTLGPSGTSRFEDAVSMLSVSSSEDEGGPGSSGRPLGGVGVSNSILEVLRDGRGSVESSKEGAASIGVAAGGEEASESGSSAAEAVRIGEDD